MRLGLEDLEVARQELLEKQKPLVVFISGGSGEGKSTLAEHFLQPIRLGNEMLVVSGRCYDRESVPFKAVDSLIDALVGVLRSRTNEDVLLILPDDIHMLAHVFPIMRRVEVIAERMTARLVGIDSKQIRNRAFAALRDLLHSIGKVTPIVMFIDDLQWGDADSARVMSGLLSPPAPPVVFFLGSYRNDKTEDSPFLHEWNVLCGNTPGLLDQREIHVAPLTKTQCFAFLSSRSGKPNDNVQRQADELFENTKSNSYFLEQLVEGFESNTSSLPSISSRT